MTATAATRLREKASEIRKMRERQSGSRGYIGISYLEACELEIALFDTAADELDTLRSALEHIARVEPNGWGCYVRERLAVLDGSRPTTPEPE